MYNITCKFKNRKFKRKFNTLSELAQYMTNTYFINFPYLKHELNNKEFDILVNKYNSIVYKHFQNIAG